MPSVIDIKCKQCNTVNTRRFAWMDPSKFKDPNNALLTSSFHCINCGTGNAVQLKFLPNQEIKFEQEIDFKSLIREDAIPFYIGGPSSDDEHSSLETLSEDAALSLLTDIDTD